MARDHRRLAAIVSLDVAGFSRLMGVDESGTLAALKAHRRELIDPKIAEHDGRIVKTTGDGLLLEFSSVVDAVRCAVEVQRGMAERNAGVAPGKRLDFRIGINLGDIIIDGDDIFGDGVNVAARLEALADPGGICVSRVVRDQVLDKLSFAFEDIGAREVKNIARPIDVYRVSLEPGAPAPAVPQPEQPPARWKGRGWRPAHALVGVALVLGAGLGSWIAYRAFLQPAVVAPYSAQDRRMTFAVLPFQAAAGDQDGAQVAAALTDAVFALQERRVLWVQVAPRGSVEQAVARHASPKDLAAALDVHFLLRGNVTRAASGYDAAILVVDAATERVLATKSQNVPTGGLTPRARHDLDSALGALTYRAVEVEVERARHKPVESLDVRDLSFRAYVEWFGKKRQKDEKGAYVTAADLLTRALVLAPDDPLALFLTAQVNLCDCVNGWSKNVEEQQAIGSAAMEKYLRHNPDSPSALGWKSQLFALRGRYEESLLITDSILKLSPENAGARALRAYALLKLGRPQEALTAINEHLERGGEELAVAAAIHYQLANYDLAVQLARKHMTDLNSEHLSNPRWGAIALTLIAAEARQGNLSRAKVALADFNAAVPGVQTLAAMRKWMHPSAELVGYEPLFEGLRLAGVSD